jgi:hypothetical protein
MSPRRKFLGDCSAAVAALAVAPASFGFSGVNRGTTRFGHALDYAAFAAQVNTPFRVQAAEGRVVKLRLIKARQAAHRPPASGRRPAPDANNEKFSLLFTGPVASPLPAAIHSFRHPQLGRCEIYIGEIGVREDDLIRYEAVFNQPAAMSISRPVST